MKNNSPRKPKNPFFAAFLSIIICGLGQIYLRRYQKGVIFIFSFICAIAIIWFAVQETEIKLIGWGEKQLIFDPAKREITIRNYTYKVTDIMKFTGITQLAFTWIFSIIDAWEEGRKK
ncbi:hypothetical protein GF312_21870 [Candidatus Poribacteria bacterium]|nr:hypothetical protein [Candidatus Poribacteria bacterium]